MYFHKYPHPVNSQFISAVDADRTATVGRRKIELKTSAYEGGLFRLTAIAEGWEQNHSQAEFNLPEAVDGGESHGVTMEFETDPLRVRWKDASENILLTTSESRAFGINGDGFTMVFPLEGNERFYGLGEKFLGLELSGKQTKFWNTDVAGDFPPLTLFHGVCDPAYVSIPYLIIRKPGGWVGILVNNPGAVYVDTGAHSSIEGLVEVESGTEKSIVIGAQHGQPDCFFLFSDSLADLTRRFQKLVGTTPLPPAWALGYHQCRWGYRSAADLRGLKDRFAAEKIPVSGLWLDIDYMHGYRVFTLDSNNFPEGPGAIKEIQADGQKVIPIIDPGVKKEAGYSIYEEGCTADVFCRNPQDANFVGLVWPGETVFPDFSMDHARKWWAEHVENFANLGFEACWNDMNDPSVGPVDHDDMLFANGSLPHWTYHNQYANGMAEATKAGFLAAYPDKRPFILSRSGYTGTARHAAIWTGDSFSNYHWLRMAIPASINLALSGVPFNGPDIGGFGHDASRQLFIDWLKACFLFPFCRNHTAIHTRQQEPWAYGEDATPIIGHFIQLRYKLRPYLYQLFIDQEIRGEAILRPLFYDFEDGKHSHLAFIDDQFMHGPALMQAPVLTETERTRKYTLPAAHWWNFMRAEWVQGDQIREVEPREWETPLFARGGQIVPMTEGLPQDHKWDGSRPELHCFLSVKHNQTATLTYYNDDGESFGYRNGGRSEIKVKAAAVAGKLTLTTETAEDRFGAILPSFVLYDHFEQVTLNGTEVTPKRAYWECMRTAQPTFKISGF